MIIFGYRRMRGTATSSRPTRASSRSIGRQMAGAHSRLFRSARKAELLIGYLCSENIQQRYSTRTGVPLMII